MAASHLPDPARLGPLVRLAGGVRPVARAADVDPGNLSRYLAGAGGLSAAATGRVAAALGLANGASDAQRVYWFAPKAPSPDLGAALAVFFPEGAEVARAEWTGPTLVRLRKLLALDLTPELYAATDGRVRAVLALPAGLTLPRELYPGLRWWAGDRRNAILDLEEPERWVRGDLDVDAFDAAWPGGGYAPSDADVLSAIRRLGLSNGEAIRRLRRGG